MVGFRGPLQNHMILGDDVVGLSGSVESADLGNSCSCTGCFDVFRLVRGPHSRGIFIFTDQTDQGRALRMLYGRFTALRTWIEFYGHP